MPKVPAKTRDLVAKYIREFPDETFKSDSAILYCSCCDIAVSTSQRFQVTQHIATAKHKRNKERSSKLQQTFIAASSAGSSRESTFNIDLCRALIRADIPFHKINNPDFKSFLERYTDKKIPDESTLRKNYLKDIYMETLVKIRDDIKNGPIWVSIDETTDVEGRYIANIIIGRLCQDSPAPQFLLNCEYLDKCNYDTIARFFNDSMSLLWPTGVLHEKVLLFLSDAAPYMVKAGASLKVFYPNMIHLTCLAHAFHRVAEIVRLHFSDVDILISNVKKIFLKSPKRVNIFKEVFPDLSLPPQPVITRWGTWLEAAEYYCKNFDKIKDVLSKLDSDPAAAIEKAKSVMEKPNLKNNLAYIVSNACFLIHLINKLETQNMPITEGIATVNFAIEKLEEASGEIGTIMKNKLQDVLRKNPGWKEITLLAKIHSGEEIKEDFLEAFSPSDLASFKYAPLTSVDVERSFSRYKAILRPQRRSFLFDNLKMYVVSNNFKI